MNMPNPLKGSLSEIADEVMRIAPDGTTERHISYAMRNAVDPSKLISNLAEAIRATEEQVATAVEAAGAPDIAAVWSSANTPVNAHGSSGAFAEQYAIDDLADIFVTAPPQSIAPTTNWRPKAEAVSTLNEADPFLELYRAGVDTYYQDFIRGDAERILSYVDSHFGPGGPRYLITSGIGANEQFNHFARSFCDESGSGIRWLIMNAPRELQRMPHDSSPANTMFMEFSRSGKTEETVKIHEYTDRGYPRAVFANRGPLRQVGLRDDNLVLDLPDAISGRYGRNTTPILLAPMVVSGMPAEAYWQRIGETIETFDLTSPDCLPMRLASFIARAQDTTPMRNHIYFGVDGDRARLSVDEMIQFWNEGVNKDGNDILMSRYFGLQRDSHSILEGVLSNAPSKIAMFLTVGPNRTPVTKPFVLNTIDAVDPSHHGLHFGDEEAVLTGAVVERCAAVMPVVEIRMRRPLRLDDGAVLGQLWADTTFCYSRLMGVDPGSNPEVKLVRDRSASMLADRAAERRSTLAR
ncbi:MAG: hypothetical protein GY788_02835 [bacterium]|nr:hypothetical protein [bacterium]